MVGPLGGITISFNNRRSQSASWVAKLSTTYSASAVDNAIMDCVLLNQLTAAPASEKMKPEVE